MSKSQYSSLWHLACSIQSFWRGQRKLMAIYTGYFDESGDEHQESFVLGGLVLDADSVRDFDVAWSEAISDLPRKNGELYFHTTDFVSGNDVYRERWKGRYDDKLRLLTNLAGAIAKFSYQTFSVVLNMGDFSRIDSFLQYAEAIGHPYAIACRIGYTQMHFWAERNGVFSPVKMLVEARQGMGEVYQLFEKDRLPQPSPESKCVPAIQAADYIAWTRHRRRHPTEPSRRVMESWETVPSYLHTDQIYEFKDYVDIAKNIVEANNNLPIPLRSDKNTKVVFTHEQKRVRSRFTRRPTKQ